MEKTIVIDASNGVLGRIASYAAKQALLGKSVVIINCNNSLITGKKRSTIEEYKIKRKRGGHSLKGPHYPKSPEMIMKRTIRGMLSYKQGRGLDAFKRIKCHHGIPSSYETSQKISLKKELNTKTISLFELSEEI
ncbi:MAG: 50S ribosomal protein L13 [Nanoarchaeota archaeon]